MATTTYEEIGAIEQQILVLKRKRTELMRAQPREEVKDYTLQRAGGGAVRLSELFRDENDLILIHNMGKRCTYCTLWADGFESMRPPIESRTAFAVVSNDDPQTAAEFAASRGWTFTVLSGKDSDFTQDMGYYNPDYGSEPGASAFHRDPDGKIYRVSHTYFGPGDDFCPTWHFFDLLQDGPNGWEPKYTY